MLQLEHVPDLVDHRLAGVTKEGGYGGWVQLRQGREVGNGNSVREERRVAAERKYAGLLC
jgi:hypothetical protein